MSKRTKQNRSVLPYIVAFCIPICVMLVVFIQRGIFPFGGKSFLRTDLYHQYAPFHQMMRNALQSGESLTYTWAVGLGTNMLSLYAYYLASPFNLLLLLCPAEYVIEFVTYSIVLKMALASMSFTYYLKKHCKADSWSPVLFGILYSLSGYYAAYSWNTMWLDCLYLFPLIILGIESLIKEKRFFLYTWSLALCILTNYYISIMICIFLVIYFFIQMAIQSDNWIVKDKDGLARLNGSLFNFFVRGVMFAFFSILAAGIACILLIPVLKAFGMTASSDSTFPTTLTSYFSIFDMLSRHLIDIDIHLGLDHWPNIFCGVGTLVMLPLYVFNKSVKPKEKILYFSTLLFLLLSFSLNVLNYIWHGFHYPNSLPARQSFIYIFLVLVMGYKGFLAIRKVKSSVLIGSFAGVATFAILAEKLVTEDFLEWDACYLTIVFAGIYTILAWFYNHRKVAKDVLLFTTITIVAVEMIINTSETSVTTVIRSNYVEEDSHMQALINVAQDMESDPFFRIEKMTTRTKNDGAWVGYNSGSIFSSSANANLTAFYKTMGMEGSTNAYSMNGSTLLMDCLFGVKYVTSKTSVTSSDLRIICSQTDMINMYKNAYALSLGFVVDDALTDTLFSNSNPIRNQNLLAFNAAGVSDLFIENGSTVRGGTNVTIAVEEEGHLYAYVEKGHGIKSVKVIDGAPSQTYNNINRGYLIDLGYHTVGEQITLNTEDDGSLVVSSYVIQPDKLAEFYNILNEDAMVVDSYDSTHVYAHIDSSKSGTLMTTIPYENGWSAYVDGEKVETNIFLEAFLSIDIPEGYHTLEFRYEVEGLFTGIVLSVNSLGLFIILTLIMYGLVNPFSKNNSVGNNKKTPKRDSAIDKEDEKLFTEPSQEVKMTSEDENSDIEISNITYSNTEVLNQESSNTECLNSNSDGQIINDMTLDSNCDID